MLSRGLAQCVFITFLVVFTFAGCGGGSGGDGAGVEVTTTLSAGNTSTSLPSTTTVFTTTTTLAAGNSAPVARAGDDQAASSGVTVTLDGSGSYDADGDPLTYSWSLLARPAGSQAAIANPTSEQAFLAIDLEGAYEVQLIVNDGTADSASDTMILLAMGNNPLTAEAGEDQSVIIGTVVNLDGSGSFNSAGTIATYSWSVLSAPAGSEVVLTENDQARTSFTADLAGTYTIQLAVADTEGRRAVDYVTVSAGATINRPPTAAAGEDQVAETGSTVTLDGSGSSDPDGDNLVYIWSLSPPAGSDAVLQNLSTVSPSFTADLEGDYTATLSVTDGVFTSTADSVVISAVPPLVFTISGLLPDTGQTASFTDVFGEDADYEINPPDFTDTGSGTILDNVTGLLWQKTDDGIARDVAAAADYCQALELGSHSDWRLPTTNELISIVDYGSSAPAVNGDFFPETKSDFYWTSSTYQGTVVSVWRVDFNRGLVSGFSQDNEYYVRCVYDGQ